MSQQFETIAEELIKLLIVDDEFIMRQGIKHMVDWEKEGFQIVGEASNGIEALELAEKVHPHIIITDIVMSQMDGIELGRRLQGRFPEIQLIVLSSYNDFEYVRNSFQNGAVDYILKPKLNPPEMIKTLKKVAARIPNLNLTQDTTLNTNNFLNRLILGYEDRVPAKTLLDIFPHTNFCLFGINIKQIYGNDQNSLLLVSSVLSEISDTYLSAFPHKQLNLNNEILVIVLNYTTLDYSNLSLQLKTAVKHVEEHIKNVFFVLSESFQDIYDIKTVYNENFCKLVEFQFYAKGKSFITFETIKQIKPIANFNNKQYLDLLNMLQFNEALDTLKKYIDYAINGCLNEYELKSLVKNAMYNLIVAMDEMEIDSARLRKIKHTYFREIDSVKFAEDFAEKVNRTFEQFYTLSRQYQENINNQIINKIILYLNEHYAEQLSLAEIAKLFHFNYHYLSKYFSANTKEGFNEYLNKVRIEKASQLLRENVVPISEVSNMVGYSDHSYFCKVFKKFTGMTPSNFRKNNSK